MSSQMFGPFISSWSEWLRSTGTVVRLCTVVVYLVFVCLGYVSNWGLGLVPTRWRHIRKCVTPGYSKSTGPVLSDRGELLPYEWAFVSTGHVVFLKGM